MKKRKKSAFWLIVALIIGVLTTKFSDKIPVSLPTVDNSILTAVFIDTGNSDSTVIHFPDGRTMLIDAGKPDDFAAISRVLESFGEDTIDYAVISHQHDDHIGSFPKILKEFKIATVYMPKSDISNPQTKESMQLIEELEIPLVQAKAGVTICDDSVQAEFLSPMYEHYGDKNDYSAVLHLTYGEHSFLFMGDATTAVENDLRSKGTIPRADILKVGHHGSKTSSGKNFLNAVQPKYAVILTGNNDYGHPHKTVMNRLHAMGIETYRSDYDGDITVTTDGKEFTISHE